MSGTITAIVSGWITTAGVLTGAAATIVRHLRRISAQNVLLQKQNDEFRADWYGQPARPGRNAQPGVMERLAAIEARPAGDSGAVVEAFRGLERRFDDHLRDHPGSTR